MEKWLEPLMEGPGDPKVLRVFADQLLERGENAWAEAIQLALDLEARWPGEDEWIDGQRRLRRLIDLHGARWQTLVWGPAKPYGYRPTFFRGVPVCLSNFGSGSDEWKHGPLGSVQFIPGRTAAKWPRLERVTEFLADQVEDHEASAAQLTGVTRLALRWRGAHTVEFLKSAPFLPRLESLRFASEGAPREITAADLDAILSLPMPKLRHFAVQGVKLTGAVEVLSARLPSNVLELMLRNVSLGAKGATTLANAPVLAQLKSLTLAEEGLTEKVTTALAAAKLDGLVTLHLNQSVNAKSAPPLLERPWPNLRELSLSASPFKGAGAKVLTSLQAPKLRALYLASSALGDDGLAELAKAKGVPGLRLLGLTANSVKGPGLVALGKSKLLSTVEELWLAHNKFQNAGAKGLADSKYLGALRELSLGHNWLGVRGLQGILKAAPKLERVFEGANNYAHQLERSFLDGEAKSLVALTLGPDCTTAVLEELLASKQTGQLEWLGLSTRAFDDAMAQRLVDGPLAKAKTRVVVWRTWSNALTDAGMKTLSVLGDRVVSS